MKEVIEGRDVNRKQEIQFLVSENRFYFIGIRFLNLFFL